jgi:uncharacterized protein
MVSPVQNTVTLEEEVVLIDHYNPDEWVEVDLDTHTTKWVAGIRDELEEQASDDENYQAGDLNIQLSIGRHVEKPFGNHLLVKGQLQSSYSTRCIRCLCLTHKSVESSFSGGYVHSRFEEMPEYEESTSFSSKGQEFDLFFHYKGKVDISLVIREALFMNIDPFPLHDKNCQGLCHTCGTDLNHEICSHSTKDILPS